MSYDTIPANNFPLHITTDDGTTWVQVGGINTISLSPSRRDADTTTFDNAGWDRSTTVSRGLTVTASGFALYDANGVKDPGQVACEAISQEIGTAARGTFRIHTPGSTAYEFTGDVNVTAFGGGANDVAEWNIEVRVSEPTSVVNLPVS